MKFPHLLESHRALSDAADAAQEHRVFGGDDYGRYLRILAILAATGLFAVLGLVEGTRRTFGEPVPWRALYEYQVTKVSQKPSETLFLGDSSLGNAIDAERWEQLTGSRTLNLALTGTYGYAGTYNMLRRALARGRPANVVIMQTADMMLRAPSEAAYAATLPDPDVFESTLERVRSTFNWTQVLAALVQLRQALLSDSATGPRVGKRARTLVHDYIPQKPRTASGVKVMKPEQLRPQKLKYLRFIVELCTREKLNCLYVHGPLASSACESSEDYLREATRLIRSTGILVVRDLPLCLAPDHVGDSADHVAPSFKGWSTRQHWRMLRQHLR